jgi:hypothetical protein
VPGALFVVRGVGRPPPTHCDISVTGPQDRGSVHLLVSAFRTSRATQGRFPAPPPERPALARYTFTFRRSDGDATSVEVHDLQNDAAATALGARVGAQHPSAAYIEVFAGPREVLTVQSTRAAPATVGQVPAARARAA